MTTFFMSTWWGDSKNMEEIEFSRWLFEGRLRQGKSELTDGLNWLCYFAGSSKSHRENLISFIFLESPHQVDMKTLSNPPNTFLGISILQKLTVHCKVQKQFPTEVLTLSCLWIAQRLSWFSMEKIGVVLLICTLK